MILVLIHQREHFFELLAVDKADLYMRMRVRVCVCMELLAVDKADLYAYACACVRMYGAPRRRQSRPVYAYACACVRMYVCMYWYLCHLRTR